MISGLDSVDPDVLVFHAGTRRDPDGVLRTAGGRVLTVPIMIQRKIILETDYPNAAALSLLLTLAVVLINLAALRLRLAGVPPARSA